MCGIAGLVNFVPAFPANRWLLQRMCDAIRHRGPDDEGMVLRGSVGLGMRRLSIIDLEGGHQPISNEDGSVWIVFNGEIYNHRELRDELRAKGHVYKTQSDTESILHLYEELGERCVERLRGMFAFAIWDEGRRRLFLARDRVGIKPLFYRLTDDGLIFASEMKAILQDPRVPREIDWEAVDAYFALSYIPAPRTIFKDILKLPPGHYLSWENGTVRLARYWDLHYRPNRKTASEDLAAEFLHLLDEAVKLHLVSDVPVGAFLSGGLDSGTLVALMSRHVGDRVKTFTIGFSGTGAGWEDERPLARLLAERYGTDHQEFQVRPDLSGLLDCLVAAFDEPFADDSMIPTYYVSRLAREQVKVVLSGLGGDELLGGYDRYLGLSLSASYQNLPAWLRRRVIAPLVQRLPEAESGVGIVTHLKRFVLNGDLSPGERYVAYRLLLAKQKRVRLFHESLRPAVAAGRTEAECLRFFQAPNAADPLDRAMYQDINLYLADDILANTDRISMWHSLEVRVPFVDHKLMEFSATIPSAYKVRWFEKKALFKKAVAALLPPEILRKKKQGFVGPMAWWLRYDLKDYVTDLMSEASLKHQGIFDPRAVAAILDEHFSCRKQHDTLIWALVVFQAWHRLYVNSPVR